MASELSRRLKELRAAKEPGWSQEMVVRAMAESLASGIKAPTRATYSSWERGRSSPNAEQLGVLASIFETNADYLLGRTQMREPLPAPRVRTRAAPPAPGAITWHLVRIPGTTQDREVVATFESVVSEKKSAEDLAAQRGTRPHQIVSLVDRAFHDGLVRLDAAPRDEKLSAAVAKALNLREAVVLSLDTIHPDFRKSFVGDEAANFFMQTVGPGWRVSFSGGTTVARMALSLTHRPISALDLYALDANPLSTQVHISASTLIGLVKLTHPGAHIEVHGLHDLRGLYGGGTDDPGDARETTPWAQETRRVLYEAGNADAAFLGVGAVGAQGQVSTLRQRLETQGVNLDQLIRKGAKADVLFYLVDADGHVMEADFPANITSVSLERLRMMSLTAAPVVAIIVGGEKAEALVAAARGGFFNTVICDSELARQALDVIRGDPSCPPANSACARGKPGRRASSGAPG